MHSLNFRQTKSLSSKIVFIMLLCKSPVFAQCIVDAGKNDTLCEINLVVEAFYLGGMPTAQGGVAPYIYVWSCRYNPFPDFPSLNLTASDFLDDTTAANPRMLYLANDSLTFYLRVTDATGVICYDNTKYTYSRYIWSLDYKFAYIDPGDSVQLYLSIHGGIEPKSYH